jgi:hypothetical protein
MARATEVTLLTVGDFRCDAPGLCEAVLADHAAEHHVVDGTDVVAAIVAEARLGYGATLLPPSTYPETVRSPDA